MQYIITSENGQAVLSTFCTFLVAGPGREGLSKNWGSGSGRALGPSLVAVQAPAGKASQRTEPPCWGARDFTVAILILSLARSVNIRSLEKVNYVHLTIPLVPFILIFKDDKE